MPPSRQSRTRTCLRARAAGPTQILQKARSNQERVQGENVALPRQWAGAEPVFRRIRGFWISIKKKPEALTDSTRGGARSRADQVKVDSFKQRNRGNRSPPTSAAKRIRTDTTRGPMEGPQAASTGLVARVVAKATTVRIALRIRPLRSGRKGTLARRLV